jgi:hypothetical protein
VLHFILVVKGKEGLGAGVRRISELEGRPTLAQELLLRPVWVGSKWCQEAAVKILDFSDKRAKSYAYFTEGISSFRKAQHGSDS